MNDLINSCLVGVNNAGRVFCDFAAGMFVQASVLIIVLLIIDLLLRKRVRATFRYCVWMLVFVKLVLPPTLCLPTGIGYWCGDYWSADSHVLQPASNIVQLESAEMRTPQDFAPPIETSEPQPSRVLPEAAAPAASPVSSIETITWQAILFLVWLTGVLIISILLLQRIRFVRWLIAQSSSADGQMLDLLDQCRRKVGIRRNVELRLSSNTSSPAVCGLFRPIILMPTSLIKDLSPDKLRAVFIHELAHIKRGDLWVNLVQTLLQIIYFYNPFVWLANAIIRRIREQAVDEMVLVALGPEAKSYSNTLIDIAEMAFWRASFSLRLIGVVESKKALQTRIKHMLTRPIPRSTKVGIFGLLAVIGMAAVLLPMAAATTREEKESDPRFTATLPNGVAVELVGVCEHPSKGNKWCRADGTMIEDNFRPYAFKELRILRLPSSQQENKILELAVKITDSSDGNVGIICSGANRTFVNCRNNVWGGTVEVGKEPGVKDFKIGVAAGAWETLASSGSRFGGRRRKSPDIVFTEAYNTQEGYAVVIVTHKKDIQKENWRVVAIDKEGEAHEADLYQTQGIGEFEQDMLHFKPLNSDQIRRFEFQTRPYQWVTFKNVSLRPGRKTEVQVEVLGKAGASAKKRKVYLPDLERPDAKVVLDLATSQMFSAEGMEKDRQYFNKLGKGDIVYEYASGQASLLCLRGATMQLRTNDGLVSLKPDVKRQYFVVYVLEHVPCQYQVTTAEGDKYELKVFSVDKADTGGAHIEYWKADVQVEPARTPLTEFTATLPNGVAAELVGVCEHPSEGKQWWRPDGQPIAKPYERLKYAERSGESKLYEVVYRLLGSEDIRSEIYSNSTIMGHISLYPLSQKVENLNIRDAANAYGAILLVKPDAQFIRLEIGAGRDCDWKTLCTQPSPVDKSGTTGPGVVFQPAIEKDGKTYVTIAHQIKEGQIHLIAVDHSGQIHESEGFLNTTSSELGSCQVRFDLPADQIKEIQFQTQKFQRVAFKNVSLRPGYKTDVQIEAETPDEEAGLVWGEAVNGLRAAVEFVPEKESYEQGEVVGIRFHLQNVSNQIINLATPRWWIQSRCFAEDQLGMKIPTRIVPEPWGMTTIDRHRLLPGQVIKLESGSLAIAKDDTQGNSLCKYPVRNVVILKPGQYSLHYWLRFPGITRRDGDGKVIVPQPDDWQGALDTGKRKLVLTSTAESDQQPAVQVEAETPDEKVGLVWGRPVEGVQARLRADKYTWEAEERPIFKADIRNRGELELSVFAADEFCQLQFDGTWYGWSGPWGRPNVERSLLGPGSQISDISISLAKKWVGAKEELTLTAGVHTVRVAFIFQRPEREYQDLVRAVSNPVEITIERALPGSRLSIDEAIQEEAAFAAVCEAVEENVPVRSRTVPGVSPTSQVFQVVEVLFGKAEAVDRVQLNYKYLYKEPECERAIRKHERVIWIGHTRNMSFHGSLYGLKALPDTPETRQAVKAAASQAATAWGEAMEGVQICLRCDRLRWTAV